MSALHNYQISELIELLDPFLKKGTGNKVRAVLEAYGIDQISSGWSTADVHLQANSEEIALTEEEAQDVLEEVDRRQDASIGINWTVISCTIEERGRQMTPGETARFNAGEPIIAQST